MCLKQRKVLFFFFALVGVMIVLAAINKIALADRLKSELPILGVVIESPAPVKSKGSYKIFKRVRGYPTFRQENAEDKVFYLYPNVCEKKILRKFFGFTIAQKQNFQCWVISQHYNVSPVNIKSFCWISDGIEFNAGMRFISLGETLPEQHLFLFAIRYPECGNGVLEQGEQCDRGRENGVVCQIPETKDARCEFCSQSCKVVNVWTRPLENEDSSVQRSYEIRMDSKNPETTSTFFITEEVLE